MTTLIIDPYWEEKVLEARRANGADRYDEVWDGVYIMSPMANNEHQRIGSRLVAIYDFVLDWDDAADVCGGVNLTDRETDWKKNYRCPDVAVFLAGTKARNRRTHWVGGPDMAVEIVSPGDRTREKLPFYEKIGTRELLLVDREPWQLELYRLRGKKLKLAGTCTLAEPNLLESKVLPLSYTLLPGKARPKVEVTQRETGQKWLV